MQAGFNPDPVYVNQIDDYLALSAKDGKGVRTGILTDGKHWLLRWHGAGAVKTTAPYGFTLQDPEGWLALYEWLRDDRSGLARRHPLDRATHREASRSQESRLPARHRRAQKAVRSVLPARDRQGQAQALARPASLRARRDCARQRPDGRPLRAPHLPHGGHRHGRAGILRHRHPRSGSSQSRRLGVWARVPQQDRLAGRRRVRLLRMARRSRRRKPACDHGAARGALRLAARQRAQRHRRAALRDGHPARRAPHARRILHSPMACPRHDPRTRYRPAEPDCARPRMRLRHVHRRGNRQLHRSGE